MQDRRSQLRKRTFKAGTLAFDHAAGISCTVRNISGSGACLEVASPLGIPESCILVIDSDRLKQPCRVVWRSANRIGVKFD